MASPVRGACAKHARSPEKCRIFDFFTGVEVGIVQLEHSEQSQFQEQANESTRAQRKEQSSWAR
jgi:hypothetical protein